jgi:hypothetical protein
MNCAGTPIYLYNRMIEAKVENDADTASIL